jgi:hypothetical protein
MTPMPPPKATTEGPRDRQVVHEITQLIRALQDNGPQRPDELAGLVGARYWDEGRFDRAVAMAAADGYVVRAGDGRLDVV